MGRLSDEFFLPTLEYTGATAPGSIAIVLMLLTGLVILTGIPRIAQDRGGGWWLRP